jgi:hypothetical protein
MLDKETIMQEMKLQESKLNVRIDELERELFSARQSIIDTYHITNQLLTSRLFKLVHFLVRLKNQFIKGNWNEKKDFFCWIIAHFRNKPYYGIEYNPLLGIINSLKTSKISFEKDLGSFLKEKELFFNNKITSPMSDKAKKIRKIVNNWPNDRIIIYPHVVNWEPLQTPQQILRTFARKGWLCFFCEHLNSKNNFFEIEPGLHIVMEADFLQAIGTTHVTVLVTWMGSHAFVEKIVNKTIWYHILDQLDIFHYYGEYYLYLHSNYITNAQILSYVAKPLKKYIPLGKEAIYLPNGVNNEDFIKANLFIPDEMQKIVNTGHKIIGYYGCLAEWMDFETVRFAALARPNYEFVFIGLVITDISQISALPNIHILGLKPYKELPSYARQFDVGTIPFLINDMMDCVSPIKFYEYCALGLPVICSKMPEVENYQNEFIACYNNANEYLQYLDLFCETDIKTKAQENGPLISLQNSWDARVDKILQSEILS